SRGMPAGRTVGWRAWGLVPGLAVTLARPYFPEAGRSPRRQHMPDKETLERAEADLRSGKSAGTAAGEFVKEEMEHIREGKHGARSRKQAVAIGLSQARRAGIPLPPPPRGRAPARTRKSAAGGASAARRRSPRPPARRRSGAGRAALKREGRPKLGGQVPGAGAGGLRGAGPRARRAGTRRSPRRRH